jgi:hypothetical protein
MESSLLVNLMNDLHLDFVERATSLCLLLRNSGFLIPKFSNTPT